MQALTLNTEIWLPESVEKVFSFFGDAKNLQEITPPWLSFRILTPGKIEVQKGTLIDYSLRWRGIPMKWQTEISEWEPCTKFVDRQLKGPYKLWVHEHIFESCEKGTLCKDVVTYAAPLQFLSKRIVQRDVESIFSFRHEKLRLIFGC